MDGKVEICVGLKVLMELGERKVIDKRRVVNSTGSGSKMGILCDK